MSQEEPAPDYIHDGLTLPEILEVGVSESCEFLPTIPEEDIEFAKICTGLANHEGGVILLGVDPDGAVSGLTDAEDVLVNVSTILDEHSEPVPEYSSKEEQYNGEKIVVITVPEHDHLPHAVTWDEEAGESQKETYYVFYKRRDRFQRQIGPYQIWRLMPDNESSEA